MPRPPGARHLSSTASGSRSRSVSSSRSPGSRAAAAIAARRWPSRSSTPRARCARRRRPFSIPHDYAGDVTAATFIFARPCTSVRPPPYDPSDPNSGPAPQYSTLDRVPYDPKCTRVNPLAESGITLAFDVSAADEPHVTGECTLTVDLTNARPIDTKRFPQLAKANLTSIDALVRLAITTLEANARGALSDCKIAYVGRSGGLPPRYRPPVSCDAAPGQPAGVAAPAWKPSAEAPTASSIRPARSRRRTRSRRRCASACASGTRLRPLSLRSRRWQRRLLARPPVDAEADGDLRRSVPEPRPVPARSVARLPPGAQRDLSLTKLGDMARSRDQRNSLRRGLEAGSRCW